MSTCSSAPPARAVITFARARQRQSPKVNIFSLCSSYLFSPLFAIERFTGVSVDGGYLLRYLLTNALNSASGMT